MGIMSSFRDLSENLALDHKNIKYTIFIAKRCFMLGYSGDRISD
jgi:hypothetical protein